MVDFAWRQQIYTAAEESHISQSMKLFICTAPYCSNNKYQKFIFQLIGNEVNTFYGNLIKLCYGSGSSKLPLAHSILTHIK